MNHGVIVEWMNDGYYIRDLTNLTRSVSVNVRGHGMWVLSYDCTEKRMWLCAHKWENLHDICYTVMRKCI